MSIPKFYYNTKTFEVVDEQTAKNLKENFDIVCKALPLDAKVIDKHYIPKEIDDDIDIILDEVHNLDNDFSSLGATIRENSISSEKRSVKRSHEKKKSFISVKTIITISLILGISVTAVVAIINKLNDKEKQIIENDPYKIEETSETIAEPTPTPYVEKNIVTKSLVLSYKDSGELENFYINFDKLVNEFYSLDDSEFFANVYKLYNDFSNVYIDGLKYEGIGSWERYGGNGQTNIDYALYLIANEIRNNPEVAAKNPISAYYLQNVDGWNSFLGLFAKYQNEGETLLGTFLKCSSSTPNPFNEASNDISNEMTAGELMNEEYSGGGRK